MVGQDTEQSRIPGSRRPDGHELGVECDVGSCDERVVGLDDGWEYDRGIVCASCIKFRSRHHHWPDEEPDHCRECILDDGGDVHDCSETSIDVLLRPGDECPECGFELAATDGGQVEEDSTTAQSTSGIEQSVDVESTGVDCPDCGSEVVRALWFIFGVRQSSEIICSGCRKRPHKMARSLDVEAWEEP